MHQNVIHMRREGEEREGRRSLYEEGAKKPSLCVLRRQLKEGGHISRPEIKRLILDASMIFREESNLVQVAAPVVVLGDVHGHFFDLLRVLDLAGPPLSVRYLFLGNLVNRGLFSVEALLFVYALKIHYRNHVYYLRGAHETKAMVRSFDFRKECLRKLGPQVFQLIVDSLQFLPLAALAMEKFFCVSGGISPSVRLIEEINRINRFGEPGRQGLVCDLLWSDPCLRPAQESGFSDNKLRGVSCCFGPSALVGFLEANKLMGLIRGHQVKFEGFQLLSWREGTFPTVTTLWSAPNYLKAYKNKGAFLELRQSGMTVRQIVEAEHPIVLPQFQNLFQWSLPVMVSEIIAIMMKIIRYVYRESPGEEQRKAKRSRAKLGRDIRQQLQAESQVPRHIDYFLKVAERERENETARF